MRFIQETYHKIHIQCVHNIAESKLTKEEVEKDMTAKLNAKFKHPFEIEYEWMDSIPPDKNGKLRMIVCKADICGNPDLFKAADKGTVRCSQNLRVMASDRLHDYVTLPLA